MRLNSIFIVSSSFLLWLFAPVKPAAALGGKPHQTTKRFRVPVFQRLFQLREFLQKPIHFGKKSFPVIQKQLAPHSIVDFADAGQIPEGIARIRGKMFRIPTGHQSNGKNMSQL